MKELSAFTKRNERQLVRWWLNLPGYLSRLCRLEEISPALTPYVSRYSDLEHFLVAFTLQLTSRFPRSLTVLRVRPLGTIRLAGSTALVSLTPLCS
jgi:hypothetical protein